METWGLGFGGWYKEPIVPSKLMHNKNEWNRGGTGGVPKVRETDKAKKARRKKNKLNRRRK